jgi:hypothetical protein
VPGPATPIVSPAETQLQIQAAAASAHDAVAVGVLAVDVGLLAAAITVGSALAPDRYPSLVAIGVSGLPTLVALLQVGEDMGATPAQLYQLTDGLTEEAIAARLIVYLDEIGRRDQLTPEDQGVAVGGCPDVHDRRGDHRLGHHMRRYPSR